MGEEARKKGRIEATKPLSFAVRALHNGDPWTHSP